MDFRQCVHRPVYAPSVRCGGGAINRLVCRTSLAFACCKAMFGLFKKDPIAKLEKEHREALAKAFELSKVDRRKADELTARAAEIEREIEKLRSK